MARIIKLSEEDFTEHVKRMKRKILTSILKIGYKIPFVYRLFCKYCFGKKIHIWRNMIAKLVKRESKILEIACGIFPAIKNGIVLDKSLLLLQNIEANGNLKTVCASALSMPFSENSFDFAVSVFPPGITTDGEFFLDRHFWAELRRILSDNGVYIAVIYVLYKAKFWRFLAKMVDPLPKEFWEELDNVAFDFHIKERRISDPFGNILLVVEATKL